MKKFNPEGVLINSEKNKMYLESLSGLKKALANNVTLEANAVICDSEHNLKIDIKNFDAYILREDVALGIKEGSVRDIAIISRVGKPVCFKILSIDESEEIPKIKASRVLALKEARTEYINLLKAGDVIPAKVTHLESFGAFVDIGCGHISLIGIENISVSRINHPRDRFYVGQDIFVIVTENLEDKINLSHKELLGTWKENADKLIVNSTVTGIIRSVEDYGIFIELSPNLSGLAESRDNYEVGDTVSVHIKSINEERMKIKLNIIGKIPKKSDLTLEYYIKGGVIDEFQYSPSACVVKNIYRKF